MLAGELREALEEAGASTKRAAVEPSTARRAASRSSKGMIGGAAPLRPSGMSHARRNWTPRITLWMRSALADLRLSRLDVIHAGAETFPLARSPRVNPSHDAPTFGLA